MSRDAEESKQNVTVDTNPKKEQPVGSTINKQMVDTYATGSEPRSSETADATSRKTKKNIGSELDEEEKAKQKKGIPNVIIGGSAGKTEDLPPANKEGTIGTVPFEKLHPKDSKNVPDRDINKYDTSISGPGILDDLNDADKDKLRSLVENDSVINLFPWKKIMGFSPSGKGTMDNTNAELTKTYIMENYYNDWYSNIILMVGTCFFAWLFAYIGLSWWSLGLVFFGTTSVYNTEYRRFNRNIRDDLKRVTIDETMSGRTETTLWLNSFLSKFWVIYMPVLSKQVKDIANPILDDVAPGYGIEALTLEEFTLGTKAPAIRGIKSYTKAGKDIFEMDWSFEFTPNDVSDMTPIEAREKINPKISLGVTLGKSFVSKTISVLVEDMNVAGRIRVRLQFGKIFPNIKIVSIQLLEAPMIDFVLKPLGGDSLGIDVMSFLPGLKTLVKKIIDSVAGPMLYAPNHMDIDVEEIMAAKSNDAIGVVAVTVSSASNLVGSDFISNTVDPYVIIKTEKSLPNQDGEVHTIIKSDIKNPVWNETKYILINSLDQKLTMSCWDFNDVRKDQLIGTAEFDMTALYQTPGIDNASTSLLMGAKSKGTLNYSIQYYPVMQTKKKAEEEETEENEEGQESVVDEDIEEEEEDDEDDKDSDAGILMFTLQKAQNLPTTFQLSNSLSPSVEMYLDGKLIKRYRTLKRINEPSWNEMIEFLVTSKESSKLTLKVYDNRSSGKVLLCSYSGSVEDLVNAAEAGQESIETSPQGKIFMMAQWKPIKLTGVAKASSSTALPLGSLKINVGSANITSSLNGIGDVDPYFTLSLNKHIKYRSPHFSDTLTPQFNSTVYIPIVSENQVLSFAMADYQSIGSDRKIGSLLFPLSRIIEKKKDSKGYICKSGFSEELHTFNLSGNKSDTVQLGFEFINTMQVYTAEELKEVKSLEEELKAKKEEFEKKQAEYQVEMDKKPDDWQVVDIKDPFEDDEKRINAKERLSFDELISHNSGVLNIFLSKGTLPVSTYLQILVDSIPYPQFLSPKYNGRASLSESVNLMIRDLKHSKLLFRVTSKKVPKDRDDLIAEQYLSTFDLLKKGFDEPTKVEFNGTSLELRFNYYPAYEKLPVEESVQDTGILSLKLVSASDLMAADRNGKSDPFAIVYVDGCKVYKSKIIKKTLEPVWNETTDLKIFSKSRNRVFIKILDWDRAGDNDYLGEVELDLNKIESNDTQEWEYPLNTKGTLKILTKFNPQYVKPDVEFREKGLVNSAPLKAIGAVGGAIGTNPAANMVTGVASGGAKAGAKAGGKILKSIGANKLMPSKSRPSHDGSRDKKLSPTEIENSEDLVSNYTNTKHGNSESRRSISNDENVTKDDNGNLINVSSNKNMDINEDAISTLNNNNDQLSSPPRSRFSLRRLSISSAGTRKGANRQHNESNRENNITGTPDTPKSRSKSINSHHSKFGISALGGAPNILKNSNNSIASNSSSTLTGGRGKVSVLAVSDMGKHVVVRVTLLNNGQREEIFKTKPGKSDSKGSCYYQAQSAHFSASPDASILFEVIESHKLIKDKSLGTAKASLLNPEIKDGDKSSLAIGSGRIIFQIQYQS